MNPHLQKILDFVSKSDRVTERDRAALAKEIKEAEKAIEQQRKTLGSQQRELEIEAALERVRSRTMAMHQSGELKEVVSVLYGQLDALGMADWGCSIMIFDEQADQIENWIAESTGSDLKCFVVEGQGHPVYKKLWQHWKKQGPPLRLHHTDEKKWEFDRYWLNETGFSTLPEKVKRSVLAEREIFLTYIGMRHGLISVSGYTRVPDEKLAILQRFTKVFEQTYTRFMDLQKAESQTREAQIEAALERVRASALAMHASEDLWAVTGVLRDQMALLGEKDLESTIVQIYDIELDEFEAWYSFRNPEDPHGKIIDGKAVVKCDETAKTRLDRKKYLDKETDYTIVADHKMLKEWYNYLDKVSPLVVERDNKGAIIVPEVLYYNYSKFSGGALLLITSNEAMEPSKNLLKRSAEVFNMAYTRFLDLQKAEAQAREAQIEAALERIRASAMAMHHSNELSEVLTVLFDQFDVLGINPVFAHLSLIDLQNNTFTYRMTGKSGKRCLTKQVIDLNAREEWKSTVEAFKTAKPDSVSCLYFPKEAVPQIWALFDETFSSLPKGAKVYQKDFPDGIYNTQGFCKFGYIGFNHNRKATEEEKDIVVRFATEFGRLYQRYLDIEKAEAQAKEAQIEAALEKVRSASLAMHQSKDLHNVLVMLYNQLEALGLKMHSAQILESIDDFKEMHLWVVTNGVVYPEQVHAPFSKNIFFKRFREAVTNGESFYTLKSSKRQKDNLFHHFFDNTILRNAPQARKDLIFSSPGLGTSNAIGKYTSLVIMRYDGILYSEEENEIIKRFAKVLEQSYTRFLDIQKAEAQTREAQIEAALEKVRSRSLAMHTTGEMQQVANAVYDQLQELGLEMDAVGMSGAIEAKRDYDVWIGGAPMGKALRIPYNKDTKVQRDYNKAIEERSDLFARTYSGKAKEEYINHLLTHGEFPKALKKKMVTSTAFSTSIAFAKNSGIQIARYTNEPYTTKENELLKRFAKVFEQAYIRFMDIEKAEAQAREAQIEAALEKVRSRTMAMHKSQELHKVVLTVSQEIRNLGLNISAAHLYRFEEGDKGINMWIAGDGGIYPYEVYLPYIKHEFFDGVYEARTTNKNFFALSGTSKKEKNKLYRHLIKSTKIEISEDRQKFALDAKSWTYSVALGKHSGMALLRFTEDEKEEFSLEDNEILKRFSKVFEQAYIRFMDLQKAEAQARESQIEVALERVRSRAMAMHHTDELTDVLGVLFDQFDFLGINPVLTHLTLFDEENETFTLRIARGGKKRVIAEQLIDVNAVENWKTSFANWKKSDLHALDCIDYPPEVLPAVWEVLNEVMTALPEGQKIYPSDFPDGLYTTQGHCKYGYIGFNHSRRATEEEKDIVIRFAKEFGRLYQRFLDIKKAELQAREAQIEAALERVRSKTMAMHNSEDVGITVVTLFDEVLKLGLDKTIRCGIGILEGSEQMETWSATSYPNGQVDLKVGLLDMTLHPLLVGVKKSWKNGKKGFKYELRGKEVVKYYDALNKAPEYPFHVNLKTLPKVAYHNSFVFSSGILFAFTENPVSDDAAKVLNRFASVFGQTYRRYLDLQKAEEQAREAQIEAALERIRSKAMAMHSSEDLADTVEILYNELDTLQVHALRFGHGKMNSATKTVEVHTATDLGKVVGHLPLEGHPLLEKVYEHFLTKEDLYYVLQGEELKSYYAILSRSIEVPIPPKDAVQHGYFFFLEDTANYAWSDRALDGEELKIYGRLITVLNLTYKRYQELKNAEARAREALIEAALDRVHGQIASMRSTADLERITPLVWNELKTLGIPFIRCGVFIIDEPTETVQVHLSAPDGHSLGAMQMSFTTNTLTAKAVAHWRKAQMYKAHWNQQQFLENMQTMIDLGQIKNKKVYQGAEQPPESLHLHFLPFTQGMLYVGSSEPLEVEQIDLVQSLADAFAIAYARYDDFAQLEKAKARVETTLSELKTTQNQLVQSEKMASLGELTAGIAHEIQNPLNFVNNFSEVSKELLEEMMEEMEKGDAEEVKAIAQDLIQNLEKINHHGKRADGIVKGMLQHSRSSSGEKEPTDINILADEYLRLAYHGLRAKDKTFNASLETHFDANIGKVDLMAQDMGRVILNLITNAFYVVKEKKEKHPEGYEPTVTVTTRKERNKVQIAVKDNGNGIPDAIKEKIFQPFFTTKPTGQGTGLGLSMSYDIVTKGHDGHLEVKTKEGKGSEFIITLPINQ